MPNDQAYSLCALAAASVAELPAALSEPLPVFALAALEEFAAPRNDALRTLFVDSPDSVWRRVRSVVRRDVLFTRPRTFP